ncbi:MAG: tRNA uridine(34) 5-carboxymethylaminomethyl modification radical SAM/GNAT enzyme Elp3 [Parcubacteria group bacterium]|nr:tRNA uridine(34) 5-carboxymethylaminomethyl modification radical SAM/GNAT enzyme Elp3 [Parcubacteria group bacterium]
MDYLHDFIKYAIEVKPPTRPMLDIVLRKFLSAAKVPPPNSATVLSAYRAMLAKGEIAQQLWLEQMLVKRAVRTLSGVAAVHVMTAPLGCPANCLYCPNEPGMPKSYLSNQPGSMRAILNDFDPFKQVTTRLRALYINGHHPEKIELIENGGTWTALPRRYRVWFMTRCFEAANAFDPVSVQKPADFLPAKEARLKVLNRLHEQGDHLRAEGLRLQDDDDADLLPALFAAQRVNETARYRIIGVTTETRPDWLADAEIAHLRQIGCTKVELGVQNIDETVLKYNNRGHDVQTVIDTTTRLRDAGFKVAYHIMPGMFKATPAGDVAMFERLFSDAAFKPDFLKVYPCVVVKDAPLYKLWERGVYVPYSAEVLLETLLRIKQIFPRYCRVARLVRDIPPESVSGGNKITNLREVVQREVKKRGLACQCVRCREISADAKPEELQLNDFVYDTLNGTEHFLTFDSKADDRLYAFLRLRLPKTENPLIASTFPELKGCGLIREIHTYGKLARLTDDNADATAQHTGLGKQLMLRAEQIASEQGFSKIAVISGIGTREYYRKLGYTLEGTYMVKGV